MKISLEWLKEYVEIRLKPEALAERLTLAGLEVIGVERVGPDVVFDLEITPNRPDCLSVIGIAREIAAINGSRLRLPSGLRATSRKPRAVAHSKLAARGSKPAIRVEDRRGCTRYIGRLFEEVRVGPSPAWMTRRLAAVGLRSINNVVDITNYVLLETGQPLHAFDADRLAEGRIVVRRAAGGERIVTIDGETRTLTGETLAIADARQPVAIAGVMGGQGSEVTASTRRVLLESARFDPVSVRRASRRLALRTESSYRFERGVDWHGVETASQRAASLIAQLAGGRQVGTTVDVASSGPASRTVRLSLERVSRYVGVAVPAKTVTTMLQRLGARCGWRGAARLDVTPPSWRPDVTIEADLLEEIVRLIGYDRIPAAVPSAPVVPTKPPSGPTWFDRLRPVRAWLVAAGLDEAITFHLLSRQARALFAGEGEEPVAIVNPLSREQELLRTSLLPGLARAAAWNVNHGVESVQLFELGTVYSSVEMSVQRLAVALTGVRLSGWRSGRAKPDLFDLKGLVEAFAERWSLGPVHCASGRHAGFADGATCDITLNGQRLGVLGQCSDAVLAQLEVRQPIYLMEIDLAPLAAAQTSGHRYDPSVKTPVARRDLAVVVGDDVAAGEVARLIGESGAPLVRSARCFDLYRGSQVPVGSKSLAFALELGAGPQPPLEAEVAACLERIVSTLRDRLQATTRSMA